MKLLFIFLSALLLFISCGSSDDPATGCYSQNECTLEQYCDFSANEYDSTGEKTGTCLTADSCKTKDDCEYGFDCDNNYCKPLEKTDIDDIVPDTTTPDTETDEGVVKDDEPDEIIFDDEPDEIIPDEDNITEPVCGNGIVETGELCDDGNNAGADYCSSDCQTITGSCGDSEIQENEACDDGNIDDNDYCSGNCQSVSGSCGDGNLQSNETCDDGNTNDGDYCSSDCQTVTGNCGDAIVQSNETCDDGNSDDNDYCSNDCHTENGSCGDGSKQSTEDCDDGNSIETDYCSSTCTVIGICGDGILQSNEACDDSNTLEDEACSADCMDIPLKVESTTPENNSTEASTALDITVTFNEPIDCNTAKNGGVTINSVAVENSIITCNDTTNTLTITYPLQQASDYSVVVTTAVTDKNGYALKSQYEFSFTTVSVIQSITYTTDAITVLFSTPINCDGDATTTGSIKKELTVKWDDDADSATEEISMEGAVTCNALEKTATFTSTSGTFDFYNKIHTVTIGKDLEGLSGTTLLGGTDYSETYQIKRYFYDGFEDGNSKWIFDDQSSSDYMTWEIGTSTMTSSPYPGYEETSSAYKGSNVLATNLGGYYSNNEASYANINESFSADTANMELTFFAFINTQSSDYLQIITKNLDTNLETTMNITCLDQPTWASLNGSQIGGSYSSQDYLQYKVVLDSLIGTNFGIKFFFNSNSYTNGAGIYIDEVQLVEEERIIISD